MGMQRHGWGRQRARNRSTKCSFRLFVEPCREEVPFDGLEVDVCVWGEHAVEVIKRALVDGRGVVDQRLLDFEAIRNFRDAQHASIEHDRRAGIG
jgi:hypothetical protein